MLIHICILVCVLEYKCSHAYFLAHYFALFLYKTRVVVVQLVGHVIELGVVFPVKGVKNYDIISI